jgi:hypothetical protein
MENYWVERPIDWKICIINCVTHVVAQPVTHVAVYSMPRP